MRLAAADDDDLCGWGEGGEGVGGDGGCECTEVLLAVLCISVSVSGSKEEGEAGRAYTTEKVAYKYYQNPAGAIFVVGIQALESILLLILIQHAQVGGFVQVSFGRWVMVDADIAFEFGGGVFDSHSVQG